MRRRVLKVVAGATLMMAMAIGVQMNNAQQSESSLMMENIAAIAMAGGEGGGTYVCIAPPRTVCRFLDDWTAIWGLHY